MIYYRTQTSFWVDGKPTPQGSKSFKGIRGGKAIMVESAKNLPTWRAQVQAAAAQAWEAKPPLDGAVAVELSFILPRPKSLSFRKPTPAATKRNGDIDKLARAVLDALTASALIQDDAQVIYLLAEKRTAERDESPGVHVTVMAKGDWDHV